ncbi:MAG TPA: AAA family ATPase [Acidimicrobiales bacterium]|nr:AAA family ATPase [Acidimicrobiales bacterium]
MNASRAIFEAEKRMVEWESMRAGREICRDEHGRYYRDQHGNPVYEKYEPEPEPSTSNGATDKDADPVVEYRLGVLRSKLLSVEGLAELPAPEPLIDKILMRNRLGVLWGKPGSGKSFVALDWGMSIGTGAWWMDHEVTKGPVLFVAAEGVGGLSQRVEAWSIERQVHQVDPGSFAILPMAPNLLDRQWAAAVVALATAESYALVIIDTLARVMVGGDENGARDMGVLIDVAGAIQAASSAAVLFVHHDTKEGSTMRGSSALIGAADTSIECKADGTAITLKCEKQKDSRAFEPIKLQRVEVASSCVIRSQSGVGPTGELTASEEALRKAAWDCCGTDGLSTSELMRTADMAHGSFYRALKSLLRGGELVNVGTEKRPRYRPPTPVGQ